MKFTRKKVWIGVLLVLLVGAVAVSQTVSRHARMCRGFGMDGHMLGFFSHYLDLTDAQQAQIKQIMEKEKPTIQPLLQQIGQGHQQLRQLEQADTFDEAKVRALVAQNSQALTELIVQKARIQSELMQVLTPDQKAKFIQFMNRKHDRFQKWMDSTAQPQS
jgi:periplasmic protein CpxP/Spy